MNKLTKKQFNHLVWLAKHPFSRELPPNCSMRSMCTLLDKGFVEEEFTNTMDGYWDELTGRGINTSYYERFDGYYLTDQGWSEILRSF